MNTINYYYTPQKRERVIFIGNRKGLKNYHPKPILQASQYITTGAAIADLMDMPENKGFQPRTDQASLGYGSAYA